MPLIDLQRRLVEVGRIRLGTTEERERRGRTVRLPKRLETWRLTSRDRARLDAAAAEYGGTVQPWGEEWELVTAADTLAIMLIPGQALSQWWELWGQRRAGSSPVECLRRCDGRTEVLGDQPCLCPPDYDERRELAAEGKACKPTSRLSVLLPAVPGIGHWRLDTRGYYAAVELGGSAELLERATASGVVLPAKLRLEYRKVARGGETRKFPVPVIDVEASVGEVLELGSGSLSDRAALPSPTETPRRRRKQEEIGPAPEDVVSEDEIPVPEAAAEEVEEVEGEVVSDDPIEEKDRRRLFAVAREHGVSNDRLKAIVREVAGVESTTKVPQSKLTEVLAAIEQEAA